MFILITGTPYCGTKYTKIMLEKAFGLEVGHEKTFKDGAVSWKHLIYLLGTDNKYRIKLHQVRNPLNNINAMSAMPRRAHRIIYNSGIVPYGEEERAFAFSDNMAYGKAEEYRHATKEIRLLCAMLVWYYWNAEASKLCDWTYQIEKLEEIFGEFCGRIGTIGDISIVKGLRKDINSKRTKVAYGKYVWGDLEKADSSLCLKIKNLMLKYGYGVN